MSHDTIAAISTADAMGAVSIIRISGPDTFEIVKKLCHKDMRNVEGYRMVRSEIYDQQEVKRQIFEEFKKIYKKKD